MLLGRLYILTAALLWSTAGACIKLSGLNAWQLSAGRSGVAALFLWLMFKKTRVRPTRSLAWVAAAYATTVVLFVLANKLTTAANAIFIQDCAPLYILLLSPWVLGEKPSRGEWLSAPIFGLGMVLFFMDKLGPGGMAGNVVAAFSGVAFAFCIMGLRHLRDGVGGNAAAAWGNLLAFVVSMPFALDGPSPTVTDWGIVFYLGVFQLGLAYAAFSRGVKDVPATEAALLALVEPVLSAVWAAVFAHEIPGPFAMCGAAVVLGATAWRTLAGAAARRNAATAAG